jgi:hypothetical protein
MKESFYKKVGRRYVPVYKYDSQLLDSFPKGHHLITVNPGSGSTHYNVEPAYAALLAASLIAEEKMCDAMREKSESRPQKRLLTEEQRQAWQNLAKALGDDLATLQTPSALDVIRAGTKALQEETLKLLSVPGVKKAYDQFIFVSELTRNHD